MRENLSDEGYIHLDDIDENYIHLDNLDDAGYISKEEFAAATPEDLFEYEELAKWANDNGFFFHELQSNN